jgi:CoA:oxalate CoA-transferase
MPGPLDGIKILDFTWALAGPYGVMHLADLGATVWKIEIVQADEQKRGVGPVVDGINTYFFSVNRGKDSILIDLKSEQGREIALSLAEEADIVTENFSPGTMAKLGLDYEAIKARNPEIIYCSLSGFGQTGPYAHRGANDIIIQGMSGIISITGHADGPPARPGYSIGDLAAGLFFSQGVLAAIVEKQRSGKGQYLDVSMLESQVNLLENAVIRYFATGELAKRMGTSHQLTVPFQAFTTSDGHIVVSLVRDFTLFCSLLERDEIATDARFLTNELRLQHHQEIEPLLNEAFSHRTTQEWIELMQDHFLVAPMNTIDMMANDEHLRGRGMFVELDSWKGPKFTVVNSPLKYSRTKVEVKRGADRPGGHTKAILQEQLGMSDAEVSQLMAAGVVAEGSA